MSKECGHHPDLICGCGLRPPRGLADLTREQLLEAVSGDNGEAEQRLRESMELRFIFGAKAGDAL